MWRLRRGSSSAGVAAVMPVRGGVILRRGGFHEQPREYSFSRAYAGTNEFLSADYLAAEIVLFFALH
jgi:hypothetical protein